MTNLINSILLTDNVNQFDAAPIPNKEAVLLIKEYWDSEGTGDKKTKAVWFSISDLLMILGQINKQNGDGARIFFGKYPDKDVNLPLPEYVHMNTVVFVPTVANGGGHKNVIDIESLVNDPSKAIGSDAVDHGQLCPTQCS